MVWASPALAVLRSGLVQMPLKLIKSAWQWEMLSALLPGCQAPTFCLMVRMGWMESHHFWFVHTTLLYLCVHQANFPADCPCQQCAVNTKQIMKLVMATLKKQSVQECNQHCVTSQMASQDIQEDNETLIRDIWIRLLYILSIKFVTKHYVE